MNKDLLNRISLYKNSNIPGSNFCQSFKWIEYDKPIINKDFPDETPKYGEYVLEYKCEYLDQWKRNDLCVFFFKILDIHNEGKPVKCNMCKIMSFRVSKFFMKLLSAYKNLT
jgi:hypothetical protein